MTHAASAPAGVLRATAAIKPYLHQPTDIGVSAPLSRTPRGARIDFLECSTPACKMLGDAIAEAANALGAKLTRVNAGQSPQTVLAAWNQVIADPPDAVIQGGFPPALEMAQLKAMKARRVPVLTAYSAEAPGLTTSVVGTSQYEATGSALANFVVAQSGGKAHTVIVTNNDIPGLLPQLQVVKGTYAQACPSCKLDTLTVPLDGIGRTIPGQMVSYLQKNPDVNWIVFSTPDFIAGVPQALRAAGITGVNAVTQAESTLAFNYIKNHQLLQATYGISLDFTGWRLVDTAARLIVGDPAPKSAPLPAQFLFAKDLTFDISGSWPAVPGYKQQFIKLWGSSK